MLRLLLLAGVTLGLQPAESPLTKVAEIALPGAPTRFDYQSLDARTGRLFLSHMGDGRIVVVDGIHERVLADLPGFATVTGVLAVPEENKLYASAAGTHEIVVVDLASLEILTRLKGADFPDGIAYAPEERRIFVSDESGGADLVIDAATDKVIGRVELGGGAGNTHYDAGRRRILVAVQTKNELAAIDPKTLHVSGRFPLPGSDLPHGFVVDEERGLAYVSCEGNAKLLIVDLASMAVVQSLSTNSGPDVLAFDRRLRRLYVACESGSIDVFQAGGDGPLAPIGVFRAAHAHSVSVNQESHRLYVPLKDVGGRPVLWILEPSRD